MIDALDKEVTMDIDESIADEDIERLELVHKINKEKKQKTLESIQLARMESYETADDEHKKTRELKDKEQKRTQVNPKSKRSLNSRRSKASRGTLTETDLEDGSPQGNSRVVLISKKENIKGHVILIKLESSVIDQKKAKALLTCYDLSIPGKQETVEIPYILVERNEITPENILDFITIEVAPLKIILQISNKESRRKQDSFSSHDNPSIAYDINGTNNDKESGFARSESLRKQNSIEEKPPRILKGLSSSLIETTPKGDREAHFLSKGFRKPKPLLIDEAKQPLLGIKVPEVTSGREKSHQGKNLIE